MLYRRFEEEYVKETINLPEKAEVFVLLSSVILDEKPESRQKRSRCGIFPKTADN